MPSDYDANFKKAEYTFLYQLVFDPRTQKQVRLTELPEGVEPSEFEYAGVYPLIFYNKIYTLLFSLMGMSQRALPKKGHSHG